jgi:hypothetical protein
VHAIAPSLTDGPDKARASAVPIAVAMKYRRHDNDLREQADFRPDIVLRVADRDNSDTSQMRQRGDEALREAASK